MVREGGTMGLSVGDIAADIITDLDEPVATEAEQAEAPAEGEGPADEAATQAGTEHDEAEGAPADEQEPEAEADFLKRSGTSLEEILEGVEDEDLRNFYTRRYKEMQAHFTKRTQELSDKGDKPDAGSDLAAQNAALRQELDAIKSMLQDKRPEGEQPEEPAPSAAEIDKLVYDGLGDLVTLEEATNDPKAFEKFVTQQSTIQARRAALSVSSIFQRKIAEQDALLRELVADRSRSMVDNLFDNAPDYRTPQVERLVAALMQADPKLSVQDAFTEVVGTIQEHGAKSYEFGEQVGRKAAAKVLERKRQASVPSSGAGSSDEPELPDRPSVREAFRYAIEAADRAG